jgi:dUTP pyrophosphatase
MDVGVYTFGANIPLPSFGSDLASCFDLSYNNPEGRPILGFDSDNHPIKIQVDRDPGTIAENSFWFPAGGTRLLVPTSMIFDLPEGHDMRVHPRSGVSYKQGLTMINCEGVVDEDYTNELFIPMINLSNRITFINHGMRLAQAEICAARPYKSGWKGEVTGYPWSRISRPNFFRLTLSPDSKANRTGGFGSTGV